MIGRKAATCRKRGRIAKTRRSSEFANLRSSKKIDAYCEIATAYSDPNIVLMIEFKGE